MKRPLPNLGGFVLIGIEGVDGHKKWKHGRRHCGMGHYVGQGCGHDENAQHDHAGFFADDREHLVGDTPG